MNIRNQGLTKNHNNNILKFIKMGESGVVKYVLDTTVTSLVNHEILALGHELKKFKRYLAQSRIMNMFKSKSPNCITNSILLFFFCWRQYWQLQFLLTVAAVMQPS